MGGAAWLQSARTLNRDAAFADGDNAYWKFGGSVYNDGAAGPHQVAMITPAFAHNEAVRGFDAAHRPLHGNRFVQYEIRAHFKSLAYRGPAVDQGKSDAALIGLALAQLLQDHRSSRNVVAIHHEGVIFVAV